MSTSLILFNVALQVPGERFVADSHSLVEGRKALINLLNFGDCLSQCLLDFLQACHTVLITILVEFVDPFLALDETGIKSLVLSIC